MMTSVSQRRTVPFIGVAWQRQSYLNILYLLAAFPLGMLYFIFLVSGVSLGVSTVIVWVGLPILVAVGAIAWWMAAFERELSIHWLGTEIPPMAQPVPATTSSWERLKTHLGNPTTWKSLLYLFLKFPLGIFGFTLVTTLVSTSLAFILAPFGYLLTTALHNIYGWSDDSFRFFTWFGQQVPINGQIDGGSLLLLAIFTPLGLLIGILSLHLFNNIIIVWKEFSRVLLGTDRSTMTA